MKLIVAATLAFSLLAAGAASAHPHKVCRVHHHHRVCRIVR
ncbi:MAG TPA: HHHH-motif protein [Caulobacteraceae bacterium]|nr:HHHH-motif protein [Caulobacteraceae bacterium]